MTPFKRPRLFLLFTVILLGPAAMATATTAESVPRAAFKACQVEEKKTDFSSSYFDFNAGNGRHIYILFSRHLDPLQQEELLNLLKRKDRDAAVLKRRRDLAAKIRADHREIILSKRRELQMLDLITKRENIQWLAEEAPDEDVRSQQPTLYINKITFEKTMAESGVPLRDIDDVMLLLLDSVATWQTKDPVRIQKFKRLGIENLRDHQRAIDAAKDIEHLKAALVDFSERLQPVSPGLISSLDNEVRAALGEKRTTMTASETALIQQFPSPETQELAQKQLMAAHQLVLASIQRDDVIAKKLISKTTGNGILTIGSAHRETLLDRLVADCQDSLKPKVPAGTAGIKPPLIWDR